MSETVMWLAAAGLAFAAAGCASSAAGRAGRPLLADDFASDPLAAGWVPFGAGAYGQNLLWSDGGPGGGRCLAVVAYPEIGPGGGWESPPFPVADRQYYRATFRARTSAPAYAAALFWDRYGALAEGDFYTALEPAEGWAARTFCFRTKFPGATASLAFQTMTREPLAVGDVEVAPAARDEVLAWADAVWAAMPPAAYEPPEDAGRLLPKTIRRLSEGRPVRAVLVGDSIANDLSNAPWDLLLARACPKADVDVRFTGRGGTGWLRHRRQVGERILAHRPDLVILLAISNDPERIGETLGPMIDAARRAPHPPEFLLVSPHLATWGKHAADEGARHRAALAEVARAKRVEFLDLLGVWNDYLARSGKPVAWLLRDEVHMNERGRQVTARALAAHLARAAGET